MHGIRFMCAGTLLEEPLFPPFSLILQVFIKTGISIDIPSIYVACALFYNPRYNL